MLQINEEEDGNKTKKPVFPMEAYTLQGETSSLFTLWVSFLLMKYWLRMIGRRIQIRVFLWRSVFVSAFIAVGAVEHQEHNPDGDSSQKENQDDRAWNVQNWIKTLENRNVDALLTIHRKHFWYIKYHIHNQIDTTDIEEHRAENLQPD